MFSSHVLTSIVAIVLRQVYVVTEKIENGLKMTVGFDATERVHMDSMDGRASIVRRPNFKPHPDTVHELTFAIKQSNADKLHDILMERSTPGRPLYRQWMSNDEVRAMTINKDASNALLAWFKEHDITVDWVNRGQEYFRVRSTLSKWERLLRTTFHEFSEQAHDQHVTAIRAESYSLPAHIAPHVQSVFGAVDFPVRLHKFGDIPSDFDTWINEKASLSLESKPMHTEAVSGITWVQLSQYSSSNCAQGTASTFRNYGVGYCIPKSVSAGVNSLLFIINGSKPFLNVFSDSYCKSPLGPAQQLPIGVCTTFNGEYSFFEVANTTLPPPAPTNVNSKINIIRTYQGQCGEKLTSISYLVNNFNNFPCETLPCSPNNYKQLDFTAPVNCSNQCYKPAIADLTTPSSLVKQYGIPFRNGSSAATQSVLGTAFEYLSLSDLSFFEFQNNLSTCQIIIENGNSLASGCSGNRSCYEANLDVQYITAMSQNTKTTYWYIDAYKYVDPVLQYLIELLELTQPPMVNSISYGSEEQFVSVSEKLAFSQEAVKLGLMGSTILVSTGDDGASDSHRCNITFPSSPYNCGCNLSSSVTNPNQTQTGNTWTGYGYFPQFPASNPYVTSVGATFKIGINETSSSVDLGASITAGGGFSSYYARPDWQTPEVVDYYNQVAEGIVPTPVSGYNQLGRGIPDVALNGNHYSVIVNGFTASSSGTSASTPLFAAMISNINAKRLSQGKGSVGFINPALYANADLFHDITKGNNKCPRKQKCCSSGFYATTGWDPVSGLGSIQYANLESILLNDIATISPSKNPSKSPTTSSNNSSTLSDGAIAGIVIGAVVFAALVVFAIYALIVWKFAKAPVDPKVTSMKVIPSGASFTRVSSSPVDTGIGMVAVADDA